MAIINMPKQVQILKQKFTQSLGLPFQELLPEATISEVLDAEKGSVADVLIE